MEISSPCPLREPSALPPVGSVLSDSGGGVTVSHSGGPSSKKRRQGTQGGLSHLHRPQSHKLILRPHVSVRVALTAGLAFHLEAKGDAGHAREARLCTTRQVLYDSRSRAPGTNPTGCARRSRVRPARRLNLQHQRHLLNQLSAIRVSQEREREVARFSHSLTSAPSTAPNLIIQFFDL